MLSENSKLVSRRRMLKTSAAVVAVAAVSGHGASPDKKKPAPRKRGQKIPVGLQLYSVRADCGKDTEGTIAAVAKMGYQGVEFAGYYGKSAKQMRKILDDNGLKCCGTHAQLDTLLGDKLEGTIEFNKIIGNKYLVVPGLPGKYRESLQAWKDTAKLFNELAEKVKPHGMQVGYHNHSAEFKATDGELPWDVFMSNTKKEVIMQLDVGNAMGGGADPLPYLYRYPGRATTVHVKEFCKAKPNALIGEGDVNWKAFFALCRAVGETEWFIVEYERQGLPPLKSVELCLKNLKKQELI